MEFLFEPKTKSIVKENAFKLGLSKTFLLSITQGQIEMEKKDCIVPIFQVRRANQPTFKVCIQNQDFYLGSNTDLYISNV